MNSLTNTTLVWIILIKSNFSYSTDPVHSGAQSRSAHESQPIEEVDETKVQTSSSIQHPIAEPEPNKGPANQQPNAEEDMKHQPSLAGPEPIVEDVVIEHIHQPVNQQPDNHSRLHFQLA